MPSKYGRRKVALRSTKVLACALAVGLGISACGSSSKAQPAASGAGSTSSAPSSSSSASFPPIPAGPIKVGIVAGTSGSDAAIGGLVKAEYDAYAAYLNKSGGIDGHQIQIIVENNQSDPTAAVSAAKKLISDGVVATFYNGSTAEAKDEVVALEQKAHIVGISPEGLEKYDSPSLYPYYFSDNPSDSQSTDALAAYAKTKGFTDVGVLSDGSPQALDYVKVFATSASTNGLKVVSSTSYPGTATTMTTQLSSLKNAGAKTLALFCYAGCGQVFDSLRQINWKPNVLVSSNVYYTAFQAVGTYGDVTYSTCPYSVEPGAEPSAADAAAINTIAPSLGGISALDQVYPETADAFAILKYAITKANSTDGTALKDALETMTAQSFNDPSVQFTFSTQHHSGYQPATTNMLQPICGFTKLGALDLPIRVAS